MPETSRECVVCLLDDTSFTVPIQGTLLGSELLDMAASHVQIKEKEYFGLFTEGEGFKNWLELDKPVLDPSQDLPKGSQSIKIHFSFKYFIDDLHLLTDYMTVELLYLQSRQAIMKGDICSDDDTLFELAACAMQSHFGEIRSDTEARQHLNSLPIIPPHVFKRVPVSQCEERVLYYYRMLRSLSRGEAIYKYLDIISSLPMYSMHYFDVKDKKEVPLWLGVGPDGICQCPHSNRTEPDCRFQWLQLQNIYYRDRKFSMEVYQNNKPSKKGVGFGPVIVYAWHGTNSKVVMAIWKMARDQHMFYRSKRTNRNPHVGMNQTEICRQLNKLHRANISPSSSQSGLSIESAKSNQTQASAEAVAAAKAAQSEMYSALLARRQILMADFEKKAARYKDILVKEMQITGIPPEGLTAEEIEKMRKKFGVSFKFSKFVLNNDNYGSDEVEELEKKLEIQSSIIEASRTLLGQAQNRKLKKDRKKEIRKMEDKYQELVGKLNELKRNSRGSTLAGGTRFYGDTPGSVPVSRRRSGTPGGASIDDNFLASMIFDTPPKHTGSNPSTLQKSPHHKSTSALSDIQTNLAPSSKTTPSSPVPPLHHPHGRKSHTLAVTDSPSYLSSIGGYADEFDDLSPDSSSVSSANASFISGYSGGGGNGGGGRGGPSAVTIGGGGGGMNSRNFDLADEFLQHFSGGNSGGGGGGGGGGGRIGERPSNSPTGSYSSPRKPSDPGYHGKGHIEIPTSSSSSSSISRYKRASSPTVGYPADSHQQVVSREEVGSGHAHHHAHHAAKHGDIRQSRSPEAQHREMGVAHHREMAGSYNPPGVMEYGYQKQLSHPKVIHHQHREGGGGGMVGAAERASPSNHHHHHHHPRNTTPPQHQNDPRSPPPPSSAAQANSKYRALSPGGGSKNSQSRIPTNAAAPPPPHGPNPGPGGVGGSQPGPGSGGGGPISAESGLPPSTTRGPRKASDQEMGILEVLNMWDKSSKNPFGDGTLV